MQGIIPRELGQSVINYQLDNEIVKCYRQQPPPQLSLLVYLISHLHLVLFLMVFKCPCILFLLCGFIKDIFIDYVYLWTLMLWRYYRCNRRMFILSIQFVRCTIKKVKNRKHFQASSVKTQIRSKFHSSNQGNWSRSSTPKTPTEKWYKNFL